MRPYGTSTFSPSAASGENAGSRPYPYFALAFRGRVTLWGGIPIYTLRLTHLLSMGRHQRTALATTPSATTKAAIPVPVGIGHVSRDRSEAPSVRSHGIEQQVSEEPQVDVHRVPSTLIRGAYEVTGGWRARVQQIHGGTFTTRAKNESGSPMRTQRSLKNYETPCRGLAPPVSPM